MTDAAPHGLGRIELPDDRDRNYPMEAVIRRAPGVRYRYWWPGGWWGDQGATPTCVAYAFLHYIADGPITSRGAQPLVTPERVYCRAQQLDPWPGDCTDRRYDGTSVRAGAKALQEMGYIGSYHWAWDVDTLADAILTTGPVVVGTAWYAGMSRPDADGYIRPTGAMQGGHAYVLNGVNLDDRRFRMKNSWGRHWGRAGYAWLDFDDAARLIADHGEAVLAVERRP